jgi:cardiolipin synthase
MTESSTLLWLLVAGFHLLGILAAIHVTMTGRTSQGTLGWLVTLIFVPYLALPLYLVFGPYKFGGYVAARRLGNEELGLITDNVVDHLPEHRAELGERTAGLGAAEQLAAMPFTRHNAARLLVDGDATFEAIFQGIDAAERYVLVQFYIVHDDELGRELKRRMIEKARAGVRVFFLYDDIGSKDLPRRYVNELRAAGAEAHSFGLRGTKQSGIFDRLRLNFRNHRKIVVVDGKKAWVGGHNVGDEYLGKDPKLSPWRDTHVEIEGPAALGAQMSFLEDWHWATNEIPELSWVPLAAPHEDRAVLTLPSGPADELETCGLAFTGAINGATQRVWIVSPYFVPDEGVVAALQLAVLRGVDVRVLIPAKSDSLLVWLAGFAYLAETDGAGVKVYQFENGFLHQKVVLVDDDISVVGTANFDNRSFRINFEVGMLFADADFTTQVREMLEADFAKSSRLTVADLEARSALFRFAVRVARLFSPIL